MTIDSINGSNFNAGMMRPPQPQEFTEAQKDQVASILSEYDPSSLSAEDAKSINASFKEAGFRGDFGLYMAIKEAGFDGDTIRELDPPSQAERPMGPPPMGGPPPQSSDGSFGLNTGFLAELSNILEKYNLDDLSTDLENELLSELEASGLLIPGIIVDTSV